MVIIPAIDLKEGQVVRLAQGDPSRETRYSRQPDAVAQEWVRRGARRLHVVDLDGAFSGSPANRTALRSILQTVSVPVQLGGGLRSLEAIRAALELGASVAILGTAAIRDAAFLARACATFPGRLALGLDARGGRLVTSGWTETTDHSVLDFARQVRDLPLAALVYTDVRRDGMLEGPDLEGLARLVSATPIPVVASGGISSVRDVEGLRALPSPGVAGAIIGKALYDGRLALEAALAAAAQC